jgi:cytidylate kinase
MPFIFQLYIFMPTSIPSDVRLLLFAKSVTIRGMDVITLDGPSKTGKTHLGSHMRTELAPEVDGLIRFDSIGNFFRRMTAVIIEEVGPTPDEAEMLAQLYKVIVSEVAFDNDRDWPDLGSDEINNLASTVGPHAQSTLETWADRASAIARAQRTDLWIVDGRNPSRTLGSELKKPDMHLVLDLFVHTEVEMAAERTGTDLAQLKRRRAQDVAGPNPLLVYPAKSVPYEPITVGPSDKWFMPVTVEAQVIADTWHADSLLPTPVFLDTTTLGDTDDDLGLEKFLTAGTDLARTALQWYNDRDV